MKRYIIRQLLFAGLLCLFAQNSWSQETKPAIDYSTMTLEQMRGLTQDDLLQIPFEELVQLVKRFKVSSIDELYQLLLNPTQSTASKKAEEVFNTPLATTVITSKELEQSGARSIPEALRLAPGVIVREKTNGDYDVHLRGNDNVPPGSDLSNSVNSSTLVMINNRPVYNNFLGATFWETLPIEIEDIDRIEIIYGPASALYGPNAVSGVIHIITKTDAKQGWSTTANIQGGTQNTMIGHAAVTYNRNKLLLGVSGNYQRMDRFQDTYYVPYLDSYVDGSQVGNINAATDTTFNASEMTTDYQKAKEKGALNLFAVYSPNSKTKISYDGAWQNSSVQTAYMDIGSVLSTRESNTFSNNLSLQLGKLDANLSAVGGHLNAVKGLPGYEYDFNELSGKVGYNINYKNLLIRPGVDANYSNYSDKAYVDEANNEGLLNGKVELGTVQGSLRADYTAFKKLRLIGAWTQGYFYQPGKNYSSYQFAVTYQSNDNTLFRAVASSSNSSPFILDTYMNKQQTMGGGNGGDPNNPTAASTTLIRKGNPSLNPMEMQMVELGMRHKFFSNLQVDVSAFYNKSFNYSEWTRDESATQPADPSSTTSATGTTITQTVKNIDVESYQMGLTAKVDYVFNQQFNASVYGTFQRTYLHHFAVSDSSYFTGLTGGTIDRTTIEQNPVYLTIEHTYTPTFYGGAILNYQPTSKWNINTNIYYYTQQKTFYNVRNEFNWLTINPKLIVNLKASYDVNKWLQVYANARNLLNDQSKEFMFTDNTGGTYLLGCKLSF